jgi:hypothetical protein
MALDRGQNVILGFQWLKLKRTIAAFNGATDGDKPLVGCSFVIGGFGMSPVPAKLEILL